MTASLVNSLVSWLQKLQRWLLVCLIARCAINPCHSWDNRVALGLEWSTSEECHQPMLEPLSFMDTWLPEGRTGVETFVCGSTNGLEWLQCVGTLDGVQDHIQEGNTEANGCQSRDQLPRPMCSAPLDGWIGFHLLWLIWILAWHELEQLLWWLVANTQHWGNNPGSEQQRLMSWIVKFLPNGICAWQIPILKRIIACWHHHLTMLFIGHLESL